MKNMKEMTLLGLLLAASSYIKAPEVVESPEPGSTGEFLRSYDGVEDGSRDGTYYAERGSGDTQGGSRGSDTATYTSGAGGKGGSSGQGGDTTIIKGAGTGMGNGDVIDTTVVARKGLGTDGSANSSRISPIEFNQALNGSISDASTVELDNVTQTILDPLKELYQSVHDSSRANASDETWYQSFFRSLKEWITSTPSKANIMEDGQQLSTLAYKRLEDITKAIGKNPLDYKNIANDLQDAKNNITEARALLSTTVALRARVEEFAKNNPESAKAPDFVKFRESIKNDAMSCRTLIEQVQQRYLDASLLKVAQKDIAINGALGDEGGKGGILMRLLEKSRNSTLVQYAKDFNATYGSKSVTELTALSAEWGREQLSVGPQEAYIKNLRGFKIKLLNQLIEARNPKPMKK